MITIIIACLVLILTNISFAYLAARNWHRAEVAQYEITQLVAQQRSPDLGAGYDTGLSKVL